MAEFNDADITGADFSKTRGLSAEQLRKAYWRDALIPLLDPLFDKNVGDLRPKIPPDLEDKLDPVLNDIRRAISRWAQRDKERKARIRARRREREEREKGKGREGSEEEKED